MLNATEERVYRVICTMSPAEIWFRRWMWGIITLLLTCALIVDAVLLAGVCNGALSLWSVPFVAAFGFWLSMAGPRAASKWNLYMCSLWELEWWDEWRELNGLNRDEP